MLSSYFAKTAAAVVIGLFSSNGYAASPWYISAGLSQLNVSNDGGRDFRPEGVGLRAGYRISKFVDFELSLSGNTEDENGLFEEYSASVAGLFLKRYRPIGRRWAFYGALGGSVTELVQTVNGTELSDGNKGVSAGIGIEAIMYDNINISLDHIIHSYNSGSPTITATGLGLRWNF